MEFALSNSHNKIYIHYDNTIPEYLTGDSLKLSQVFINLISNAIKFTQNGNIYISAKLAKDLDESVIVYFEVKDDGIGISKEKQEKIFDEFYQEHTKIENSYQGTGLGLSIVKRLLTVMGSSINIKSEVGKGATFSFELLFSKTETTVLDTMKCEDVKKNIANKRILIVDDNKINQLVTQKILNEFKVKTTVVDSGKQAVDIIQSEQYDCILMDIHMPDLDGYETTRLIRQFNTEIPIIALTASSTEEVERKINNYEMNGYIMKPFITEDFIGTIHKIIYLQ